jgi:6-phosphogluconolactonase
VTELTVVPDVAAAATEEFLSVAPRLVALAGGRTPRAFYQRLGEAEYRWEEVDVLFTDERCVSPDHLDSNFRMVQESLLSRLDPPPRIHRMPGESCDAGAHEVALRETFGELRLDLAILGLGVDGHTASLFPGDPLLDEHIRWVGRVDRADHSRLTLTIPVLSGARMAMFLVAGAEKGPALQHLLAGNDIPAARVTADRVLIVADPASAG